MDLSYQAIPHGSPALERARRDGLFGSELEFWSLCARGDAMFQRATYQTAAMAQQAAREHPGIESRRFGWDGRGYDAAYYLLSPAYRGGQGNWSEHRDWVGAAIFGAQPLHPQAVTTIGFKIRYTPPEIIREHAQKLQLVTHDDLHQHFDPARMVEAAVYKYFGDPYAFESWMWPEFQRWRDFIVSMLSFPDEGLLCDIG